MKLQIRRLILWPKDRTKKRRELIFELNRINVVTGWSQTGKSAIIPIIDYCLGADKCAIPVGLIRDTTLWFGIVCALEKREILLARREPEGHTASAYMYMVESKTVAIPEAFEHNCSADAVKERLNQLADLPRLDFSQGSSDPGYFGRPSFRDMMAFVMQPQHILANPYTLFFKADTTEHREKLRVIFPFVLGAVTAEQLSLQHERTELRTAIAALEKQLADARRASDLWLSQLRGLYSEAREFGLIPSAPAYSPSHTTQDLLRQLSTVPEYVRSRRLWELRGDNTSAAAAELSSLRSEEYEIAERLETLKHQLTRIQQVTRSTTQLGAALAIQRTRLEMAGWLSKKLTQAKLTCPVCGEHPTSARSSIDRLLESLASVEGVSAELGSAPQVFDKEIADLRKEIRVAEQELSTVRAHRAALETHSSEVASARQTLESILRFVGRLEQSLANFKLSQDDSELTHRLDRLRATLEEIERALDPDKAKQRLAAALERVSRAAAPYLDQLGVERAADPMELDPNNLTVRVVSKEGKRDFLWEIGSGSNWLGRHVALFLALHEFLLDRKDSPVPTFLVLDQPSQAYFPDHWPGEPRGKGKRKKTEVPVEDRMDDIQRVRMVFTALASAIERTKGALQIIVIDHADEICWRDVSPPVHVVARWRGSDDDWLIPRSWQSPEASGPG